MMLGAVSAAHHGWPIFPANCDSDVGVLPVRSSYVRFGMKSDKKVSNKSPMGLISYSIQGVFEIAFGGGDLFTCGGDCSSTLLFPKLICVFVCRRR